MDVRDLAAAHVKALTVPEAGGQRIIVNAGPFKWQDWGNFPFLHNFTVALLIISCISVFYARSLSKKTAVGNQSYDSTTAIHKINYDTSKADRILGLQLRSKVETATDIVQSFELKGWLN